MITKRFLGLATVFAVTAATLAAAPAAYAAVPAPVLHYTFDELAAPGASVPASSVVADSAGTRGGNVAGNGATVAAGPAGGADRALQLPGGASSSSAAHVVIPPGLITTPGDVTISAWVKWAGNQTCAWPFTLGRDSNNYLFFTPSCGGNLIGAVKVNTESRATGSGPLGTGWTHVAVALKSGQSISTFINGEQVATTETPRTGNAAIGSAAFSGYLARSFYAADPYFAGALDDFRVYTSALTAEQVAEIGGETSRSIAQTDASAGVDLGDTSAVTGSLALPSAGAAGSKITWESSDPAVVSTSGAVTRPAAGRGDAQVTLTPTFSFGGATVVGEPISVTVLAVTEDELAELFESQYVIEPVIPSGLQLPDLGDVGVEYSSDDEAVTVSEDGVVSSSVAETVDAAITVGVEASGERLTKTFQVRVLPAGQAHRLLGYQRTPLAAQLYDSDLAYSLHLAIAEPEGAFEALHDNTGVLFAEGIQVADHFHDTTTFRSPWVFHRPDGGYGVVGVLADAAGNPLGSHAGRLVYFESDDLLHYTQVGYVTVDSAAVRTPRVVWDSSAERYVLSWTTAAGDWRSATVASLADVAAGEASVSTPAAQGPLTSQPTAETDIPGAVPGNTLTIDAATARALDIRFGRIANTSLELDDDLTTTAGTPVELDELTATLGYSDGSEVEYAVDWNEAERDAIDFDTPGTYTVSGELRDQRSIFPLAGQRADPTIIFWEGRYVMVSTWDPNNVASTGIPVRVSDTIAGLATAPETRIVTNTQTATDGTRLVGCFWAPDILEVDGQLQIFVAPCYGTASWSNVVSTVVKLRPGGDPAVAADWSQPQKVLKADGSPLQLAPTHPGISLDMTYFQDPETEVEYVVWSERYINRPHPGGTGTGNGDAELWIATYDPDTVRLSSDPVLLNQATAGWEQNNADVVEAPFFTVRNGTIWMSYSGSMVDATYAGGLMEAPVGSDLLDLDSWTEWNAPVVKSDPERGQYGPGHSGFFFDEFGDEYFIYHAKGSLSGTRDAGVRKVFWASDGQPILDMTDDERIAPQHRAVRVTIVVEADPNALDVVASATLRCVAGKVVVAVTAKNQDTVPVSLAVSGAYGSKSVAGLAPGKSTSVAFTTRAEAIEAGSVELVATAGGTTRSVSIDAAYAAHACN